MDEACLSISNLIDRHQYSTKLLLYISLIAKLIDRDKRECKRNGVLECESYLAMTPEIDLIV